MLQALSSVSNVGNYQFLTTIGTGGHSEVKLARHLVTGRKVAVKIMQKDRADSARLRLIAREVNILKSLKHPNVIQLFEVIENHDSLYLFLEYARGGDLLDYLEDRGTLGEPEARAKFRQMVLAVYYCHEKRIAHQDLKPENFLVDAKGNIKLADFGVSSPFTSGQLLKTLRGTPCYWAPERLLGRNYDGPSVDVWSLGVILYYMVSGDLPFDDSSSDNLRDQVVSGRFHIPLHLSADCIRLIKKCLVVNSSKRATLQMVVRDCWLNVGYEEELTHYVEPLPHYENARRTAMWLAIGHATDEVREIRESRNQHQNQPREIMGKYLALGSQEQGDSAIPPQPQPSPVPKHSHSPSQKQKEQQGVSAEHTQHSCTEPVILPAYSFGKTVQKSRRKAQSTGNVPEVREKRKRAEAGNLKAVASPVEAPVLPHLHQESLVDMVQPSQASGRSPREDPSEGPQPRTGPQLGPVASASAHSSCSGEGHPERKNSPLGEASPSGNNQGRHGAMRQFWENICRSACLGCARGKQEKGERKCQKERFCHEGDQPRSRYFKLGMKVMSSLDPQELLGEVCRGLDALGYEWELTGSYRPLCMCGTLGREDFVQWRVELCRLPWRGLHGVQVKKISGTSRAFRNIATTLEKRLQV